MIFFLVTSLLSAIPIPWTHRRLFFALISLCVIHFPMNPSKKHFHCLTLLPCESRSGPRWVLGILASLGLLVHLMAAGCMIFIRVGYDYFGGSLAFGASFVTMGLVFSIVNRVRTVEAPAVAIVLEEGDESDGPVQLDDDIDGPGVQEVRNVVAASMLPDEDVERALLMPSSPRSSFGAGLGGSQSSGAAGAVLLMSQRALRNQSRSSFAKAFAGPKFCRFGLIFLDVFLLLVLIVEALAAYQAVAIAVDASITALPTGQLYTVSNGAYKLHLYCLDRSPVPENATVSIGNGTASANVTVILENGLGAVSTYWTDIQPALLNRSSLSVDRVCAYDRAGYGWSQRGMFPRTSSQIATELHDLLISANISGPYVMVGHSFGGMNVRVFAAKYPDLVSGVVLVDASHEYQAQDFAAALNKTYPNNMAEVLDNSAIDIARILSPLGIFRMSAPSANILPPHLPAAVHDTTLAWMSVNSYPDAIWSEAMFMNFESSNEVNRTRYSMPNGTFGDLPLSVLTAGANINGTCKMMSIPEDSQMCKDFTKDVSRTGPVWFNLQKDLASLSSNSVWNIVWDSGHNIPLEFPEVVIDAILDVAQKSKNFKPPVPLPPSVPPPTTAA
jgi:pimeloyl-ACP methyl ester carboxylesterase